MTFADLLPTLEARGALPPSRAKDCKTSLRYLAAALGYASPEACPVDAACLKEVTWGKALEAHFATLETQGRAISAATRRNSRNNLRLTFRLAETHGLLAVPLPPVLLQQQGGTRKGMQVQQRVVSPYRATYRTTIGAEAYGLPETDWPPDYVAGWQGYLEARALQVRPVTLQSTHRALTHYFGYLQRWGGGLPPWDGVLRVAPLRAFVRWHGARMGEGISHYGCLVAAKVAAIAKALAHPQTRALADFRNELKPPARLHHKQAYHWITLKEVEAVAEACLAYGRRPVLRDKRTRRNGLYRASRFQLGVILKILARIPLRSRNIRELRRGTQLFQDSAGAWQLTLRGAALKIGRRGTEDNVFEVNLSQDYPELSALLKEWHEQVRPILPGAADAPTVFLTSSGRPFTRDALYVELRDSVARYTGKRFYPHLMRTVWATECIEATQDFATAAVGLGDTVRTVLKTYYHLDARAQQAKGAAFVHKKLAGP